MYMSELIAQVLAQSPPDVTEDDICAIVCKAEAAGNTVTVVDVLAEVWKIPPKPVKPMTEWEERRKIMDDLEQLRNALKGSQKQQ